MLNVYNNKLQKHLLYRFLLLMFGFLLTITSTVWGQGSGTLLYDIFGVTLQHGTIPAQGGHSYAPSGVPFDMNSFAPTLCPPNLETVLPEQSAGAINWYGYWSSTDISTYETYWGQYPSGSEPYDVEAYYASLDQNYLYLVLVTSVPGPQAGGYFEDRGGINTYVFPGDITINLGLNSKRTYGDDNWSYDFGLDISHDVMPDPWFDSYATNWYDQNVGTELYRTANDDWYTSCHRFATAAHYEYTNFDPNDAGFSGTYLGNSTDGIETSYYKYDLDHNSTFNSNDYECNHDTYVLEAKIPRTLFGVNEPSPGDTVKVRWVEGCRNDGNSTNGCAFIVMVIDAALGDYVWEDANRDGIQDVGENGVEGVKVYLRSSGGVKLDSMYTNSNGLYAFYDLPGGDYYVEFVLPDGYMFSPQDQGGDDTLDSDVNPANGTTAVTTLSEGENDMTWDAGICLKMDFGDAPNSYYNTVLASNGARHVLSDVWMGSAVDAEWDGQPTDQDDILGDTPDDEDGIEFLGSSPVHGGPYLLPFRPGWYGAVRVTVAGAEKSSYLHGWYDWNADGDWGDTGEQIFCSYHVSGPGTYTIEFSVPVSADSGGAWSRFRIDDENTCAEPCGLGNSGEVEDYDPTTAPVDDPITLDYGDAPDATYPSFWANNGASHIITDIWLGDGVTNELDTRQIDADTDDGITLAGYSENPAGPFINPGHFSPGDYAAIDFVATGAISESDTAFLHIWIDWDRNGTWEHPGEMVVDTALTAPGSGRAVIITPAWLSEEELGTTWVRARFDRVTTGAQIPIGLAEDGEVEDYGDALVPIELTSFEAVTFNREVVLSWITESETENLGFEVYRAESGDGSFSKINEQLIDGAGSSSEENRYTYVDKNVEHDKLYYYKLADVDYYGRRTMHGPVSVLVKALPKEYKLYKNYPNPFNPSTTIEFDLHTAGETSLLVYNLMGQKVRTLVQEYRDAGAHRIEWNGCDDNGNIVPSGIYMYVLKIGTTSLMKKMVFAK